MTKVNVFNAIFQNAIDGIVIINTRGTITSVNPAAASIFGYPNADELEGHNVTMLMPKEFRRHHDKYIGSYLSTGHAKVIGQGRELTGVRKDGTMFPFRISLSEFEQDEQRWFSGIIHDLTEVKAKEAEIKQLNKELENKIDERTYELEKVVNRLLSTNTDLQSQIKATQQLTHELELKQEELNKALTKEKELNALKTRFVSMASHEFRTPLTSIQSSASLISKYPDGDQQDKRLKHINRIKSSVSFLTGILEDFLSLSKLEEGKIAFKPNTISLSELWQETEETLSGMLPHSRKLILHKSGDDSFFTDGRILMNLLINLLSNAIKYSDDNVVCSIDHQTDGLHIAVQDSGIGIPESELKHLTTRFFRATNAANIPGTGIGLNIVTRYLTLLSGTIDINSRVNQGTTVNIYIPNADNSDHRR